MFWIFDMQKSKNYMFDTFLDWPWIFNTMKITRYYGIVYCYVVCVCVHSCAVGAWVWLLQHNIIVQDNLLARIKFVKITVNISAIMVDYIMLWLCMWTFVISLFSTGSWSSFSVERHYGSTKVTSYIIRNWMGYCAQVHLFCLFSSCS